MAKRIGQVLITYEVLARMMKLDPEHNIIAVVPQTASDVTNQRFGVIMTGPRLPLTAEGDYPVTAMTFGKLTETGE
jgi:hypothetical protein